MAKRSNVFAQDFQSISKSADDAVFEFIKQGTQKESTPPVAVETKVEPKSEPVSAVAASDAVADAESAEEKQERKTRIKTERSEKPAVQKERIASKPKEWGRPTALFNTRIPQEMSDLLDDLVYRLKKEGKPHTKQTIAIAVFEIYFATSRLISVIDARGQTAKEFDLLRVRDHDYAMIICSVIPRLGHRDTGESKTLEFCPCGLFKIRPKSVTILPP